MKAKGLAGKSLWIAVIAAVLFGMIFLSQTGRTQEKTAFSEDPDQIEEYASSVFRLEVYDEKDNMIAAGSGFAVFDEPLLATACHVIVNMDHMIAYGENGEEYRIDTILDFDQDADIALLLFPEDADVQPLPLSETDVRRGEKVTVIGSQFGVLNLVTLGNICGTWEEEDYSRVLFTAPVSGGSSGGPLINDQGCVVGLVSGSYENGQNLNLAATADSLMELYRKHSSGSSS